jgi:TolA-binding protein
VSRRAWGAALVLLWGVTWAAAPAGREPRERRAARPPAIQRATGRAGARGDTEERRLDAIRAAMARGEVAQARELLRGVVPSKLPRGLEEDAAYWAALLATDAPGFDAGLTEYLKSYPRGTHRRAATLALAKQRFAEGDYREAENLLSIFSPGVERDALGREGIVWRGLAQLGRNDPAGAQQFLLSARKDLDGSAEEEAYYFALAQSALRANHSNDAIEALRVILGRHANGDYAPQALYAMGTSLEMQGRGSDAAALFRQVAQRFPGSYEATRVRDRGIRPAGAEGSPIGIGGGFAIQVGAFGRREVADGLARDLRLSGVGDVSVTQGRDAPPIYRVRAGAFSTRDEARALGERLRRERGFTYTIVAR